MLFFNFIIIKIIMKKLKYQFPQEILGLSENSFHYW